MALIVENGTGVVNANSYVSYDDAVAYAEARGKDSLFTDEDKTTAWLITAMDYLQSIRNFQGLTTYTDQFLLWPRSNVYIDSVLFNKLLVPKQLVSAQIELAIAQAQGISLFVNYQGNEQIVKRKKVDVLEKEFFGPTDNPNFGYVQIPLVEALLAILRAPFGLRTLRI